MASVAQSKTEVPLILALDVGSSTVYASLYNGTARLIKDLEVKPKYQLTPTSNGEVGIDPGETIQTTTHSIYLSSEKPGKVALQLKVVIKDAF